ncbi:MAG: DUF6586 family protein [Bermanella sp.]
MSSVRRTNQALYFSRLSLAKAKQAQEPQDKRYAEECALFHLHAATMSFAGELVAQYALPPFSMLSELLQRRELPSELRELSLLMADDHSWLKSLMKQHQRLLQQGLDDSTAARGLILSQSDYAELFSNWLIELEKISRRMREHYQEN